ncbi:AsmA family protein [Desulfovibrio sp. ZJ369]|uniref:AsmA family protein n=1 Tax=Desulfovibrio sp. ZJ369 TaxID=2709793 RepID=UPI0013EDA9A6|nr:AsmA family protein [Desulfovibrio sp. ZJ369]
MKRVLLWILGIVAVLAVAAFVLLGRIDTQFMVSRIAEATAAATGKPLILANSPRLSLLPPGVTFGQARWGEIVDGQGIAVSVKGGLAELELTPLFSGKLVVREMRLDNPVFEMRESGAESVAPKKAGQAPDRAAPQKDARAAAPSDALPVELARLVLRQGQVIYVDAQGTAIQVKDLNLSVENLRRREEAAVQCDFAFDLDPGARHGAADKLAGTLALSAKLRYYAPDLTFRRVSLTFTPLSGMLPREAGPVQLACEGAFNLQNLRLHLAKGRLSLPQASLNLSGDATLEPLAFKGRADLEGSPRKLAALAGLTLKPSAKDGLSLESALEFADTTLHLRDIAAQLDGIPLRGNFSVALGSPVSVSGGLQAGLINLDAYLPLPEKPKTAASAAERKSGQDVNRGPAAQATKTGPPAWPALNLRAALAGVRHGKVSVTNLSFILKGANGTYNVSTLSCALGSGGTLKGAAGADLQNKAWSLSLTAAGVNVGALLESLGQGRPVDGTAALNADLTTRGETPAAMQAGLNGRGTLEVRNLSLAAMSALPKNVPGLTGKEGRVPSRFDLVRVPFTARNGEIAAQPITVSATGFNAVGQARASLPRQYLDAAADIKTLGMTIPVMAKGPFSDIAYGVDPKFALDLAKKLPGILRNTGKESGNAGGALQEGLRGAGGLVKGLLGR